MAHPHNHLRAHKVEKSRVGHIAHRAKGGRVGHSDEKADRKLIKSMMAEHDREHEGGKAKHRRDRPHRAKGGKVKGKGSHVHINIMNGGADKPPVAPLPGAAASPMAPPPAAIPPGPAAGLGGPPPMGPGGPPMPLRARGGNVKSGRAWEEGKKAGTQVSHVPALKKTVDNMDRGRVVTFKCGGGVKSFRAYGGKIESTYKVDPATKLPGGAGGGEGRLSKMRKYGGKPMKEVNGAR